MGRFFNTAGPCRPEWHYMLPAAERLSEMPWLVDKFGYFVVHAPRQTGKTTTLCSIASELTASGRFAALVASCETAGTAGEDVGLAQQRLVNEVRSQARTVLAPELCLPDESEDQIDPLRNVLASWARQCPLPIVVFLDEIDSLTGQSLMTVLSQLRTGKLKSLRLGDFSGRRSVNSIGNTRPRPARCSRTRLWSMRSR